MAEEGKESVRTARTPESSLRFKEKGVNDYTIR